MLEVKKVRVSRTVMSDSLRPHGLQPTRLLCPWNFPGKNTGAGCHFLLQGIFPTQGSNLGLLQKFEDNSKENGKADSPIEKWVEDMNSFIEEEMQMTQTYEKMLMGDRNIEPHSKRTTLVCCFYCLD